MPQSKKKTATKGDSNAKAPSAMMAVTPEAMESWQEIATEWGRFVTDRLQKDIETQRAMLDCRSPSELMKVQTEFYQTAIQQYSEEAMRLMQMMSEAAGKTVTSASTRRKYDDVPL